MTHYWDNKVGQIIKENFDVRMNALVVSEIIRLGWEKCAAITDEEIENVEGNGMMTKEFLQSLLRTERRICQECDMYEDLLPFIRKYMSMADCQVHDVTLYKEDYSEYGWEQIMADLGLDDEEDERETVDVIAIVD